MKGIYHFHELKITLGGRRCCKRTKWGLGQSNSSFALFVHYSTPDGLKLIKLPAEKSDIGNISSNKTSSTTTKKKKSTLILLKVIRDGILAHSTSQFQQLRKIKVLWRYNRYFTYEADDVRSGTRVRLYNALQ